MHTEEVAAEGTEAGAFSSATTSIRSSEEQHRSLANERRRVALERVLQSQTFAKARRLSDFLAYVGECTLLDRTEEITEQHIGIRVFGRPAGYNAGEDNIVRHNARQVRQRLAVFYREEGQVESIQVVMPRGSYVLHFIEVLPLEQASSPTSRSNLLTPSIAPFPDRASSSSKDQQVVDEQSPPTQPQDNLWPIPKETRTQRGAIVWSLLVSVLAVAMGVAAFYKFTKATSDTDRLWGLVFDKGTRTSIVVSDAGLNMYYSISHGEIVSVQDYAAKIYLAREPAQLSTGGPPFADRRYTTMSDVKLVTHLLQLPRMYAEQADVRFSRAITTDDLKSQNVILIGAPNYNPWVQLFDKDMDFRMSYGSDVDVVNKNPQAGEHATYTGTGKRIADPHAPTVLVGYALVSLVDNLNHTGHVLLIQGKGMDDIEAASDFLFSADSMQPILQKARKGRRGLFNFDVVLETSLMRGGGLSAKIVATHVHSQHR